MEQNEEELLIARRFRVVRLRQSWADGTTHVRDIVRHPGAVTIIPAIDANRICLIRNYRASVDQTLIELPAGTLEPNEPHERTAARELLEETGYSAERIEWLHSFFLSPGILDEQMHLYLATGLTAGEAAREVGEIMENMVVTRDEAAALIRRGEIRDAKTLVGLMFYLFQLRGCS